MWGQAYWARPDVGLTQLSLTWPEPDVGPMSQSNRDIARLGLTWSNMKACWSWKPTQDN